MKEPLITPAHLLAWRAHLLAEERSSGTIEGYLRHLRAFSRWLDDRPLEKAAVCDWREHLLGAGYAPATINGMLAALHSYFHFRGWDELRVHYLRVQRRLFRNSDRALSMSDYHKLLRTARRLRWSKLALIIETLGATGIRVSELCAITVNAARAGRADIRLKGKIRTILIPAKLCEKLLTFARARKRAQGPLFLSASGKPLSRQSIWRGLKRLARIAGVAPAKVFPHNLRHLFATVFYEKSRDIARLADLLGHSSIETTRIYLTIPASDYCQQLESLHLVE